MFHFMQRAEPDGTDPETRTRPAMVLDIDHDGIRAQLHVFWAHSDWPILKPCTHSSGKSNCAWHPDYVVAMRHVGVALDIAQRSDLRGTWTVRP